MPPNNTIPQAPQVKKSGAGDELEKLILIILFIATVTLFSSFGYQSVIYLLNVLFSVSTEATVFDLIVGTIAIVSSVVIFAGAAMWWNKSTKALNLFYIGSTGFIIKNLIDIVNEIVKTKNKIDSFAPNIGDSVKRNEVIALASTIGMDIFQLFFWVFIALYITYRVNKYIKD